MNKTKLSGLGLIFTLGTIALVIHGCKINPHGGSNSHGHSKPNGHSTPHERSSEHDDSSFVARQITKQRTITLHGAIDTVWPLFDPLNEGKWAPGWRPEILYPTDGTVREGMVVRTHGMEGDQGQLIWTVTKYDPSTHRITYTVTNPVRMFTVDVQCSEHGKSRTDATVTYAFVGLTESGNEVSARSAKHLFESDLRDWQDAINHYLETGTSVQHH